MKFSVQSVESDERQIDVIISYTLYLTIILLGSFGLLNLVFGILAA